MTTDSLIYLVVGGAGFGILAAAVAHTAAAGSPWLRRIVRPVLSKGGGDQHAAPAGHVAFVCDIAGWIGALLPLALVCGGLLLDGTVLQSLDAYHYSHLRSLLVGGLCALAVPFLLYRGRSRLEDTVSTVGAVAVFVAALSPPGRSATFEDVPATVHVVAGAVFLVCGGFALAAIGISWLARSREIAHPPKVETGEAPSKDS